MVRTRVRIANSLIPLRAVF